MYDKIKVKLTSYKTAVTVKQLVFYRRNKTTLQVCGDDFRFVTNKQ